MIFVTNFDILDTETHDIRKITSISCTSENIKYTLLYKENMICCTSFPYHVLKKNILFVDLSARRVYPLLIFTLHCNYTTCNFGNFVKFLSGNVSQN